MKVKIIVIYCVLALLFLVALYYIYAVYQNSPQKTVERVLELRNNYEQNKDEIKGYMTTKYFNYAKGDDPQINSPKCQLSSYKDQGGVAVLCKIQTARGNEMKDEDAAIFYLVRSGLYPFGHRYQIDDIEVVDPALVETFSDIIAKQETQSEVFGREFSVGDFRLLFDDYQCEIKKNEDAENETIESAIYSFTVRDLGEKGMDSTPIFFQMVGEDDALLSSMVRPLGKQSVSEVEVEIVSFDRGCDATAVIMQSGKFEMKYKVDIR